MEIARRKKRRRTGTSVAPMARRVYVEVRRQAVEAFIKDSGEGFDPASIAADRHGVRDSIVGRMRRAGGNATIRRLARGTEIALSVPRSDILEETAPNGRTQ